MSTLHVRREEPGDEAAIARVNDAAFGQPDESRVIAAIRHARHPNISLVASAGLLVGARHYVRRARSLGN